MRSSGHMTRKVLFKAFETFLRARTRVMLGFPRDQTKILLSHFTPAQKAAQAQLPAKDLYASVPAPAQKLLIVVPFRDKWELTRKCLDSLLKQDFDKLAVRLVLVDNGSREDATAKGIARVFPQWEGVAEVRIIRDESPFNFSRINNMAVRESAEFGADHVLFINNDVEFKHASALRQLINFKLACPNAGALGCTLLYPNSRIQHLFLAPGVKIVGAHPLRGQIFEPSNEWYREPRPIAAVTGAMVLVSVEDFLAVGGFEETLAFSNQDLDLCLKLQELGRVNWVLPQVLAAHFEGASREERFFPHEAEFMYQKWGPQLTENAFYSSRLSRWSEQPALALLKLDYPWRSYLQAFRPEKM